MCGGGAIEAKLITLAACVELGLPAPDERGLVRWKGLRWRGVPRPLQRRIVMGRLMKAIERDRCAGGAGARASKEVIAEQMAKFGSCGCVHGLMVMWEVMATVMKRVMRRRVKKSGWTCAR